MPLGLTMKMRIGENEMALESIRRIQGNRTVMMEDIKRHNEDCQKWEEGYKAAIDKLREWRNDRYLTLKNLK